MVVERAAVSPAQITFHSDCAQHGLVPSAARRAIFGTAGVAKGRAALQRLH